MKTKGTISRRDFSKRCMAAALFPAIIPATALGRGNAVAPSNRIVVGSIGVGNRGGYLMETLMQQKGVQVVGICDVKADVREAKLAKIHNFYENKDCVGYNEHEELLGRGDIDAVSIGSCDHWHVLHALAATRAGIATYVEKPLGVTFDEDQMLRKEVRKHKTVFQFGTQQRSSRDFWTACELVRRGYIGDLKKINVWAPPSISGGSLKEVPPPATLDYDRWLGPAPAVPYTEARDSNAWWWFIRDYALGFIAGWGIHPMDIALWGAGKKMRCPVTVEGVGSYPTEGLCNTATKWKVSLKYESGIEVDFRDAPAHADWVARYGPIESHGTAFEGTEGWICVNRSNLTSSSPAILKEPLKKKRKELYRSTHHMQDFVDSVRNGTDPISDIDSAVHGDGICHISDIALRLGRKLHWDHKKEQFDNDTEANARLRGAMRAPWSLEG